MCQNPPERDESEHERPGFPHKKPTSNLSGGSNGLGINAYANTTTQNKEDQHACSKVENPLITEKRTSRESARRRRLTPTAHLRVFFSSRRTCLFRNLLIMGLKAAAWEQAVFLCGNSEMKASQSLRTVQWQVLDLSLIWNRPVFNWSWWNNCVCLLISKSSGEPKHVFNPACGSATTILHLQLVWSWRTAAADNGTHL